MLTDWKLSDFIQRFRSACIPLGNPSSKDNFRENSRPSCLLPFFVLFALFAIKPVCARVVRRPAQPAFRIETSRFCARVQRGSHTRQSTPPPSHCRVNFSVNFPRSGASFLNHGQSNGSIPWKTIIGFLAEFRAARNSRQLPHAQLSRAPPADPAP